MGPGPLVSSRVSGPKGNATRVGTWGCEHPPGLGTGAGRAEGRPVRPCQKNQPGRRKPAKTLNKWGKRDADGFGWRGRAGPPHIPLHPREMSPPGCCPAPPARPRRLRPAALSAPASLPERPPPAPSDWLQTCRPFPFPRALANREATLTRRAVGAGLLARIFPLVHFCHRLPDQRCPVEEPRQGRRCDWLTSAALGS